MKRTEIRYDELKVGEVIMFHGALERVVEYEEFPAPANEYYPNEKTICFTLEPVNDESVQILGGFYSKGTYGGVGCGDGTYNIQSEDDRFMKIDSFDGMIYVDKETKVQYLFIKRGYAGGLTVLVDSDGKPLLYEEE